MSSFSIRCIALLCMLIDHAGLALFPSVSLFRCIGRIAFPLYCFLLVQGFLHTRNLRIYAQRLLVLAVLSEVPFDLLVFGVPISLLEQNAVFSLLLGLLCLHFIRSLSDSRWIPLAVLGFMLLSMLCFVSYGWYGPALCFALYYTRQHKKKQALSVLCLSFVYSLHLYFSGVNPQWAAISLCAAGASLFILAYNHEKGPSSARLQMLFYLSYPVHLLLLVLLRHLHLIPPWFSIRIP